MTKDTTIPDDPGSIRVVIADDHTLFRDGLKELLVGSGFDVVADAADGSAALSQIAQQRPDIALLDVQMPGPGPISLLEQAHGHSPDTRVIFLSMHEPPELVQELESRGAAAYLRKTIERDVLSATIKAAAVGMVLRQHSPRQAATGTPLTSKEIELLQLVARSYSNRQIAAALYISESTVKRHLTSVYNKLGATSRVEALSRAIRNGLISGLN